ncbi:uncharacterized protein LOC110044204 [Orbicella faveolata]|uniref:uncharacterized protein LOC110044204 n=1 Tax=Orbicella faveolata TaxID=48498 RepID=UPI0009E1CB6F|nr:uncharacterized protein LOC110044204 [Orbicella faveolata]
MASFTLGGLFVYVTETFTAGVIQSYEGQGLLEDAPLIQRQDPLEDFKRFDNSDTIFQEYDAPPGDHSKIGWKRSRPSKWWMSLWKAVKDVFCIQILGGLTLGTLAIFILVLDFNSVDLCYDKQLHGHWNSLPRKIQAIIVSAETVEAYVVQMWTFLLIITMFGWRLVKKLNLLILNLLGAFFDTCYRLYLQVYGIYERPWMSFPLNALFLIIVLMNSILVGREIANSSENERPRRLKKTIKVSAILAAQLAFGIPIALGLVYGIIPLYGRQNETYRAVIAGALPLLTAVPKVIVRLTAQRIDFLHPGDSHVLLSVLYSASAIVFRVMQAELTSIELFIILSLVHGAVDLLERLTIVVRDYLWYIIYKKFKRDADAEPMLSADKFRTPRSMRFIADMSIQMILGESTALVAAVGFIQLYSFMYNNHGLSFSDMHPVADFFIRVSIALSIDFIFNSFSFWLQMSYLNIAVVRVWKKKWRKHMVVGLILTTVTMCYFTTHLFAVVKDKHKSGASVRHFNCTGPFSEF